MADGSDSESHTLDRLKQVGEVVGVVGGMGAAFAGLAFGIGYIATKHHDEMLGIPTTTTDYTTYVRTGSLFFTQSLHDVVNVIAGAVPGWVVILGTLTTLFIAVWLLRRYGSKFAQWLGQVSVQRWLVCLGFVLVLVMALSRMYSFVAPLDAGNSSLLFEQRPIEGAAKAVNDLLRSDKGEQELHRLYGLRWALVLGLLLSATALNRSRARIPPDPPASRMLSLVDRAIRPAAYAAVFLLLATTPAIYGVMAMSTSLPCVQLYKAGPEIKPPPLGQPGYLFSDLSSEKASVLILRWDPKGESYFVDFHPRDSLVHLEVSNCSVRNPIHRIVGEKADTG